MKILLTVATKHGATGEIGQLIAGELRERGHEVLAAEMGEGDPAEADAVVLGSAVYMSRWLPEARVWAEEHADRLSTQPLWIFSSGLAALRTGQVTPAEPALLSYLEPRDARHFHGRLDPTLLSLRERSVTRLTQAPVGDFRDWSEIRAWARTIDKALVLQSGAA